MRNQLDSEHSEREEAVKTSRKQLLTQVLEEGYNVDERVTADTRRIIRLPGSIHGTTGYQCTVRGLEQLEKPLKDLLEDIPRIESAQKIHRSIRSEIVVETNGSGSRLFEILEAQWGHINVKDNEMIKENRMRSLFIT